MAGQNRSFDSHGNSLLDALGHNQPLDKAFMQIYGITLDEFVQSYNQTEV